MLVDASFGFEMETFEFLNILQVHGFPKVMGILTHLDMIPNAKTVKKTKKRLKQRFWTEIYQVFIIITLFAYILKKRSKGMNDFFHFLFILCFLV